MVDAPFLLFLGGQNSPRKKSNPRQSSLSQTTHSGNNLALLLSSPSASPRFCPQRTQYVYFKTVLTVSNYSRSLSHCKWKEETFSDTDTDMNSIPTSILPSLSDVMVGPCSTNGEKRNAYRLLVGKQEGKRPLGRPRRR
jgi:hypothetical protein